MSTESPTAFDTAFVLEMAKELAKWLIPLAGAFVAVFFTPLVDRIKLQLNRAELRTKQFEEFASDISAFVFQAELMYEFLSKGWNTEQLIDDYNKAITLLRTKELVYLSWAARFWKPDDQPKFVSLLRQVKAVDIAIHAFNDGDITAERIAALGLATSQVRDLAFSLLVPSRDAAESGAA
jgi:hypothetical protein